MEDLQKALSQMQESGRPVVCVGDVMLDRFVEGRVDRISPESPVPVLKQGRVQTCLGGAGNVVRNLGALGCSSVLIGVVGRDGSGDEVRRLCGETARLVTHLVEGCAPTTVKTRYVAQGQQLLRTDEESLDVISPQVLEALMERATKALEGAGALILSDYNKGLMTPDMSIALINYARERNIPVLVDPKSRDFGKYARADVLTPNVGELCAALGPLSTLDTDSLVDGGRGLMSRHSLGALMLTRSEQGILLIEADDHTVVEARAREVFDVAGAGDTVIACVALGLMSGVSLRASMMIANEAAGLVVGRSGTATVTLDDVWGALKNRGMIERSGRFCDREEAVAVVQGWRHRGLKVGFTNGCFDLLHRGHVHVLREAKAECDRLVVGLNSDASVQALKGDGRPVRPCAERAELLGALRDVAMVTVFDEETPLDLIRALEPDVLVKGGDYTEDQVVGARDVRGWGGDVVLVPCLPGVSTTALLDDVRGAEG